MLGFLLAIRLGSNTVAPEVSLYESRLEKYHGLIDIVGYRRTFTRTALAVARKKLFARFENHADSL